MPIAKTSSDNFDKILVVNNAMRAKKVEVKTSTMHSKTVVETKGMKISVESWTKVSKTVAEEFGITEDFVKKQLPSGEGVDTSDKRSVKTRKGTNVVRSGTTGKKPEKKVHAHRQR